MLTHYQALGVSSFADLATIRKAYHKISLLYHPDKTIHLVAPERARREHLFKLANIAFEVLSDTHKRKTYDETLGSRHNGSMAQDNSPAAAHPPNHNIHSPFDQQSRSPPRSSTQGPGHLHRAPLSTFRFSASTLGKAPDFHWYHCELSEREERTRFTYSNWLGWRFSINLVDRFKVVAKPIIPEGPVKRSIVVRLPLQRCTKPGPRPPVDIVTDLMGTPDSNHAVLSSALIETKRSLELLVELTIANEVTQKDVPGPVSGKLEYRIDYESLPSTLVLKVTSVMIYPFKPHMALSPTGGLPAMPYPDGSPMRGLLNLDPEIQIEKLAPELYCREEKQSDITRWRLLALGSK